MCGLAGEVRWNRAVDLAELGLMSDRLSHRGPDDSGCWTDANHRCALVHRRLSIIDLSPLGRQPMQDAITGNVLAFNGEIYNYLELRQQCEREGEVFLSRSDTEVILALYRRHGTDCLRHLRGMFSIALWDHGRQRLFLARDRFGKKPLHYSLTPDTLLFCSEIHPLALHPAVSREMDLEALELYLQLQAVPAPWTIYRQIRKLPPAHFALFDRSGLRVERYWEMDFRDKNRLTEGEVLEAFEEVLREAVRLRMISDVPIGALLSGGVDSSVVVALMSQLASGPVKTFSIGFEEQAFNELPFAKQAAEVAGTMHHAEIVRGDVMQLLPMVARHYGEPYGDSSAVPSFFVSRVARSHVAVALNGDGGDELLGGYDRYAVSDFAIRHGAIVSRLLGPRGLVGLMPIWANAQSFPARAIRRLSRDFMSPELGGLLMFMGYWNDRLRADLMAGVGSANLLQEWRLRWLEEAFQYAGNPIDRMLWLDSHTYLPDDLLVKMDIASMHCGLETRSPLLDHRVVEFCARLPVEFKVRHRTGKYLLKRLAEKFFTKNFVYRRKMGFGIPVAAWLRGPLRSYAEDIILSPSTMEPLNMQAIHESWKRLQAATGPAADAEAGRVWALLMYGQWRQLPGAV